MHNCPTTEKNNLALRCQEFSKRVFMFALLDFHAFDVSVSIYRQLIKTHGKIFCYKINLVRICSH